MTRPTGSEPPEAVVAARSGRSDLLSDTFGRTISAAIGLVRPGSGLDLLDSEHAFAFAIGVGVAVGRVLGDPIRLPRLIATWPRIGPVTRASRSSGGRI